MHRDRAEWGIQKKFLGSPHYQTILHSLSLSLFPLSQILYQAPQVTPSPKNLQKGEGLQL